MTTLHQRESTGRSPLRLGFLLIPLLLGCFALSPQARAVDPPPDGGHPNQNTAEGEDALFSLTVGTDNTATGSEALASNTTGVSNAATAKRALFSNTASYNNTASSNIAVGVEAGSHLTTGSSNIDIGKCWSC